MRNIDYIRKMKPKELAAWLSKQEYGCDSCIYSKVCNINTCGNYECITGIKSWLKRKREE